MSDEYQVSSNETDIQSDTSPKRPSFKFIKSLSHLKIIKLCLNAYILHLFNKGQIKLVLRNFYTSLNKCIDRFRIFHIVQVRVLNLDKYKAYNECYLVCLFKKKYVSLFILDPFAELFLTICIMVNTVFLALDHHDINPVFESVLSIGNYVSF